MIKNGMFIVLSAKDVLWSDNSEAQLLQTMFLQAHKGKWFPMSNKTPPYDDFILKGGQLYRDGDENPFTGWYAQFDESDEPRMLCSFVDGKKNGFTYLWDGNGVRRFQGEYLDNFKNGQFLEWNEYAIQTSEKNYKLNKLHGEYQLWYDSGKIKLDAIFNGGKLLEARGWYPDGRPCPYSKVINGRGVILRYKNDQSSVPNKEIEKESSRIRFPELSELKNNNSIWENNLTSPVYEFDQFRLGPPKND